MTLKFWRLWFQIKVWNSTNREIRKTNPIFKHESLTLQYMLKEKSNFLGRKKSC